MAPAFWATEEVAWAFPPLAGLPRAFSAAFRRKNSFAVFTSSSVCAKKHLPFAAKRHWPLCGAGFVEVSNTDLLWIEVQPIISVRRSDLCFYVRERNQTRSDTPSCSFAARIVITTVNTSQYLQIPISKLLRLPLNFDSWGLINGDWYFCSKVGMSPVFSSLSFCAVFWPFGSPRFCPK